jgi:hypothetical protein
MDKEKFLKVFEAYSDEFLDAIPLNAKAHIDWMMYSEDFIHFVKTGKLPGSRESRKKSE